MVAQTNDAKSRARQDCISGPIVRNLVVMNGTIEFKNKPVLSAVEINDEAPYDLLPTKFQPKQTTTP